MLFREDMYKILPEKFELDLAYIIERERQWIGQAVVARDDRTGAFALGKCDVELACMIEFSCDLSAE